LDFRILPKVQPLFHEFLLIIIASYAELLELIITAVVNIEIYVAFNARQLAHIRMLPELPFALILNLVNIIVGYPVRIIIEDRRTQILLLEFIIGAENLPTYLPSFFHAANFSATMRESNFSVSMRETCTFP
jgi:hypothetical protein